MSAGEAGERLPIAAAGPGLGAPPPLTVITVHGTNDADLLDRGERWWQLGSLFARKLVSQLAARGLLDAKIQPHHWSGANSDFDRLDAARRLRAIITEFDKLGQPFAILAHSHGGNIAMEALADSPPPAKLVGVVSFGTPFFRRHLKTVPWMIALFRMGMGLIIAPIMVWYLVAFLTGDWSKKFEATLFFGALLALALHSVWTGALRLARTPIARHRLKAALHPKSWLVVHSPRDEAMRVLETAAALQPSYVTLEAAKRSLASFGSLVGVVGTILFFAWNWRYFLDPITSKIGGGRFDLGVAADFTFVLLAPVVYGAIYGFVRLVSWAGGAWLYAKMLSHAIHGGVIGAAFGGDGLWRLGGVVRKPPYFDDVAEDRIDARALGGIDDAAVFEAARQLYDNVVAHDGPDGGIGDPDRMWKRLSDALYHNAYMRDDGVIATVADHLVRARRQRG